MRSVLSFLDEAGSKIADGLLENRIAYDEAYTVKSDILRQTRLGIRAVKRGDPTSVAETWTEIKRLVKRLRLIPNFPDLNLVLFLEEVYPEIVEFAGFEHSYPAIFFNAAASPEASPVLRELEVPTRAIVRGLLDLPGELGKAILKRRSDGGLTLDQEIALLERFVAAIQDIATNLHDLAPYRNEIDLSPYERERFSFDVKLGVVGRILQEHRRILAELKVQERHEEAIRSLLSSS